MSIVIAVRSDLETMKPHFILHCQDVKGNSMLVWRQEDTNEVEGKELVFLRWGGVVWVFEDGMKLKMVELVIMAQPKHASIGMPWFRMEVPGRHAEFLLQWYGSAMLDLPIESITMQYTESIKVEDEEYIDSDVPRYD